jgi:hypothetical protein
MYVSTASGGLLSKAYCIVQLCTLLSCRCSPVEWAAKGVKAGAAGQLGLKSWSWQELAELMVCNAAESLEPMSSSISARAMEN